MCYIIHSAVFTLYQNMAPRSSASKERLRGNIINLRLNIVIIYDVRVHSVLMIVMIVVICPILKQRI